MATKLKRPVPIILCGQTEKTGSSVIEGLKPDYEVVRFIITPEACVAEIPSVLQRRADANDRHLSSSLGTGNIAGGAKAIVLGGAYADNFDSVHDPVEAACEGAGEDAKVAWIRQDGTKPAPPPGPEYGKAMVSRVRETLAQLEAEGKLGDGKGGVYWY